MQLKARYVALSMLSMLGLLSWGAIQPADSRSGNDDNNALPPLGHTFFCLRYPLDCTPMASTQALPISPIGRWRKMNLINSSVNASIAPKPVPDRINTHWLIAPRKGDCNDYAVTKRHRLLDSGWPSSSLLLAEVTLILTGEHHLILIVRDNNVDWVLDNLKPDIERLAARRNEYALDRVQVADSPKLWTNSFSGLS